jgi:hypothetical protein
MPPPLQGDWPKEIYLGLTQFEVKVPKNGDFSNFNCVTPFNNNMPSDGQSLEQTASFASELVKLLMAVC